MDVTHVFWGKMEARRASWWIINDKDAFVGASDIPHEVQIPIATVRAAVLLLTVRSPMLCG